MREVVMARGNGGEKSKRATREVRNAPSILDRINLDEIEIKITNFVEKLRGPNNTIISRAVTDCAEKLLARDSKMTNFVGGGHRYTFAEARWVCRTKLEPDFLRDYLKGVVQIFDGHYRRLGMKLSSRELEEVWTKRIEPRWNGMLQTLEEDLNDNYPGEGPSLLQSRMREFEEKTGRIFKGAVNEWREKVEEAVSVETFGQINAGELHPITLDRTEPAKSKAPSRKRRLRFVKSRSILPSKKRARTVARIIDELNILKPSMYYESDYDELKRKYSKFITFKMAAIRGDLKEKVLNLQDHRRHYRLAQELAAAYHGRAPSTLQTDWKKHKPKKFRRTSS
jgi:hypothetical protein